MSIQLLCLESILHTNRTHNKSIKLTGFYVSKDQQGNGVGNKLFSTAIERATLTNYDSIYLIQTVVRNVHIG